MPLDIRDYDAVEKAFDDLVAQTGRIDILINNAAGNFIARAEDITANGWSAVVGIVLNGSFFLRPRCITPHAATTVGQDPERHGQLCVGWRPRNGPFRFGQSRIDRHGQDAGR